MRTTIPIYYDIATGKTYTSNTFSTVKTTIPVAYDVNEYTFKYYIANNAVPVDLSSQSNFSWGIGTTLGTDNPDQTVTGDGTNINNSADTPDLANGISTVRVLMYLQSVLGTSQYVQFYTELRSNSTSDTTTIAFHNTTVKNIVYN